jgi:hypothetical protein
MVLAVGRKVCSAKVEKTLIVNVSSVQALAGLALVLLPAQGNQSHVSAELRYNQLPLARM